MPIYISRGRFTSDAVKGMLAKPENRERRRHRPQTGFDAVDGAHPAASKCNTELKRRWAIQGGEVTADSDALGGEKGKL